MTGAAVLAVQEAMVSALGSSIPLMAAITGVYDGPPPQAAFPYVSISETSKTDWSTKTFVGREVRMAVTLWDSGEQPSFMQALMADIEQAILAMDRDLDGWRAVSVVFARSFVGRDPDGPWAGTSEFRIRVMAD